MRAKLAITAARNRIRQGAQHRSANLLSEIRFGKVPKLFCVVRRILTIFPLTRQRVPIIDNKHESNCG